MYRKMLALVSLILKVISVSSGADTGEIDIHANSQLAEMQSSVQAIDSRVRRKRIVHGQSFKAGAHWILEYQAAIFPGQFCNNIGLMNLGQIQSIVSDVGDTRTTAELMQKLCYTYQTGPHCTGTAITPTVVQTACHCIARPIYRHNPSKKYRGFLRLAVFNAFEDLTMVKIGVLNLDDVRTPTAVAEQFFVHESCTENRGYILYDFGLIALKYSTNPDIEFPWLQTKNELIRTMNYIEGRELVCMIVGWGFTDILESKGLVFYDTYQRGVHFAWHVLVNRYECYLNERLGKHFKEVFPNMTSYVNKATWICHKPFGRLRSIIVAGDAGGPVICLDEVYFAIQQWHHKKAYNVKGAKRTLDSLVELNGAAPLAYNPVPNALEFRVQLNWRIIGELNRLRKEYPHPVYYSDFIPSIDENRSSGSSRSFTIHWWLIILILC